MGGTRSRSGWVAALALIAGACGHASQPPARASADDMVGVWGATLEHGGTTTPFGLELRDDGDDGLMAFFSLPAMKVFDVPAGKARLEDDKVVIGSMTLTYDPVDRALSGKMPSSLVPVHTIPIKLKRVPRLEGRTASRATSGRRDPLWVHEVGAAVWAGIAAEGGRVFVAGDDGIVRALEPDAGRPIWSYSTGGTIRARPVVMGDSLLVHSDDGRLHRLDARSGSPIWIATLEESPPRRLSIGEDGYRYDHLASAPAVAEGLVFIGQSSRLHALEAETGRPRWVFQAGDLVTSTPAVGSDRVFFGSFDGKVHAVSAVTGEDVWSHDTGAAVPTSPALYDDLVVIGSRSYDLLALSADDGSVVWDFYYWFSWVDSSATINQGVAYIGSSDAQRLRAINAATGEELWNHDTGGWTWAQPAVSERVVFIGSVGTAGYFMNHEGSFHAVDRETGRGLWKFDIERPANPDDPVWGFASSPAVMSGRVFVGGLDGRIYAFSAEPTKP